MQQQVAVELAALQAYLEGAFIPWSGRLPCDQLTVVEGGSSLDQLWISLGKQAHLWVRSSRTDLVLDQEGAQRKTRLAPAIERFCERYLARMRDPYTRMEREALLAQVGLGERAALEALWGLRPTNRELDLVLGVFQDEEVRGRALAELALDEEGMEILLRRTDSRTLLAAARKRREQWTDTPGALAFIRDANPYRAALAVEVAALRKGNLKALVQLLPESPGPVREAWLSVMEQAPLSTPLLLELCLIEGPNAEACLLVGAKRLRTWDALAQLKNGKSAVLRKKARLAEERIRSYQARLETERCAQVRWASAEVLAFLQDLTHALAGPEQHASAARVPLKKRPAARLETGMITLLLTRGAEKPSLSQRPTCETGRIEGAGRVAKGAAFSCRSLCHFSQGKPPFCAFWRRGSHGCGPHGLPFRTGLPSPCSRTPLQRLRCGSPPRGWAGVGHCPLSGRGRGVAIPARFARSRSGNRPQGEPVGRRGWCAGRAGRQAPAPALPVVAGGWKR